MPGKKEKAAGELNANQTRFVQEYLVDLHATEAAKRAGYSARTAHVQGSRLLSNAKVSAKIAELQAKKAEKFDVSLDKLLLELLRLALSNMQDYTSVSKDGDPYVDLSKLTREQWAAIQELTVEDYLDGRGEDAREVRRLKIKLYDKRGPLTDLGKHLGAFIEKHAVVNPDGSKIEPDEYDNDLPRRIAHILTSGLRAKSILTEPPVTH